MGKILKKYIEEIRFYQFAFNYHDRINDPVYNKLVTEADKRAFYENKDKTT